MNFGDAIVVFDLDGTLCEFKYGESTILAVPDELFGEYCLYDDPYKNVRPLKTMQRVVGELDSNNIFVLSKAIPDSSRKWKRKWIGENYRKIQQDNVLFTHSDEEKVAMLRELVERFPRKEIYFVEDKADNLVLVEAACLPVKLVHISWFIE